MGAIKQELLGIAQAFGEAGHDLATTPEEAEQIVASVTKALQRLRRLIQATPEGGEPEQFTVGKLIEALQGFDSNATVWMPDWNEDYRPPTRVRRVVATEPKDWEPVCLDDFPKPESFDTGVILNT